MDVDDQIDEAQRRGNASEASRSAVMARARSSIGASGRSAGGSSGDRGRSSREVLVGEPPRVREGTVDPSVPGGCGELESAGHEEAIEGVSRRNASAALDRRYVRLADAGNLRQLSLRQRPGITNGANECPVHGLQYIEFDKWRHGGRSPFCASTRSGPGSPMQHGPRVLGCQAPQCCHVSATTWSRSSRRSCETVSRRSAAIASSASPIVRSTRTEKCARDLAKRSGRHSGSFLQPASALCAGA